MTRYGHIGWRVIAVVAFAGTAALAVILTRVPAHPNHAALSSSLTPGPCATSGLDAWVGLGTLASGATAHSVLRVTGISQFQPAACARVTAPELRVILPDQGLRGRPAFVRIALPACSKKGPKFLSVQPIQPRPGIPGFALP